MSNYEHVVTFAAARNVRLSAASDSLTHSVTQCRRNVSNIHCLRALISSICHLLLLIIITCVVRPLLWLNQPHHTIARVPHSRQCEHRYFPLTAQLNFLGRREPADRPLEVAYYSLLRAAQTQPAISAFEAHWRTERVTGGAPLAPRTHCIYKPAASRFRQSVTKSAGVGRSVGVGDSAGRHTYYVQWSERSISFCGTKQTR